MLMDDPGAVEAVHMSYYRAGALCQTSVIVAMLYPQPAYAAPTL